MTNKYWLSILFIGFISTAAQAGLYRWVDEQGNVHFSDRAPQEKEAEDISDQMQQPNVDYSAPTNKQLIDQYEHRKSATQTENRQTNSHQSERQQKLAEICTKAKKELSIIRGRVVFYDKNGKEMDVSEKERGQRAEELAQKIQSHCQSR